MNNQKDSPMRTISIPVLALLTMLFENTHAFSEIEVSKGTAQATKNQDTSTSENTQVGIPQNWTPQFVAAKATLLEQKLSDAKIRLPLGGMITAEFNPHNLEGAWLILGKKYQGRGEGGFMTPAEAKALNIALLHGDGNPQMGLVRVFDGADVPEYSCISGGGEYNLKNKNSVCIVLISQEFLGG
jgi:hypothetical protein